MGPREGAGKAATFDFVPLFGDPGECRGYIAILPICGPHAHITQLVNEYFNGNVEHVPTDRLRCTANTAQFALTPTNPYNVALPDTSIVDEDAVTAGAVFLALRKPCILGGPRQRGQNQNWLPHPYLLGGRQMGGIAT